MSHQESFTFEMERVPFKSIFCNANDSVVKLMIFITSGVSYYSRFLFLFQEMGPRLLV